MPHTNHITDDGEIDTGNDQFVGLNSGAIVILMPKLRMTPEEALRHAAWLVALADPEGERFCDVLNAVQST